MFRVAQSTQYTKTLDQISKLVILSSWFIIITYTSSMSIPQRSVSYNLQIAYRAYIDSAA